MLNPTYAMYKIYSDVFSTKLITINYNKDFKLDKSTLYEVIKKGKIKVLFLPNPNQPIEDIISFKEMKKICKICLQKKILLVVDEAYHMFGAPTMSKLINTFRNIVILRTLSKSFGLPSIRFGFIISNKRIIKTMNSYRLSYESNFLTDTVVSYFLKNYKIIKNNINKIKKGREFVRSECLKLNYDVIGKYSNFLLINFKNPKIKNIIVQNLEKNKIYTKSNYSGILENCILVTCGSKKIMKKFIKLIKI